MEIDLSYILGRNIFGIFQGMPTLLAVLSYVLTALGLYTMAQRRGIQHGWLAWVPVADIWILGSLADQYRYVVRGEVKSRRKVLLTLNIISAVFSTVLFFMTFHSVFRGIIGFLDGFSQKQIMDLIASMILKLGAVSLLVMPVAITKLVIRFMALYDIYRSCEPENAKMYLVLSILISFTQPFFLFFSREKENGMPPRKAAGSAERPDFYDENPVSAGKNREASWAPETEEEASQEEPQPPEYL